MTVIYHLATRDVWESIIHTDVYAPPSFADQGYIVCANAGHYHELAEVIDAEQRDITLLFIDTQRLPADLQLAPIQIAGIPAIGLYGALPVAAVFETVDYRADADGRFRPHHETPALSVHGEGQLEDTRARALHAMSAFKRPWWIAGGWAIDCFVGRKTRPHADLEIAILRSDQAALYDHIRGWDARIVAPGAAFVPWEGQTLRAHYHQIWTRRGEQSATTHDEFSVDPTMLDFLIEDNLGDLWQYRRDPRIARPVSAFGATHDGVPFVRPEIALLFKSKGTRFKDQRDFEQTAPFMDANARRWLREALETLHPNHPWGARLMD